MPDVFASRWEIGRVSELTNTARRSPIKYAFGVSWSVFVRKETTTRTKNIPHFGVYLCCNEDSNCSLWSGCVELELILVHRTNEEKNVHKKHAAKFNKHEYGGGFPRFISFAEILNPSKGFIKDDRVIIEARVTIHSINFIRKMPTYDFTQPFPNADNVVLRLEDGTVHVCRKFLGWHSPYFASIFSEDCKDNSKEFEISNVTTKDFSELLRAILPSERPVNLDSYKPILKLADLFQIERAFHLVENFLISTANVSTSEKLFLAEEHRLELLKSHCFDSLKTIEAVKKLEAHPTFSKSSVMLKVSLLNKAFELIN